MKKALMTVTLAAVVVATVAIARPQPRVSDAEVQAAIDARLHELLVRIHAQQR
jgi:hypothetical protein